MKEGWQTERLKDLGKVQTGTTPPTADKSNYGDFIPFVKPPHFNIDGTITSNGSGLSESGLSKGRLIDTNSILMVCIGATIGKTGFVEKPVACNQQINTLTPKEGLHTKFFYYLLSSDLFFRKVIAGSSQATLPMINKSKWQAIEVSYPKSLPEQERIVAKLDTAFAAIDQAKANTERNLQNAKELFQSKLNEVFSQQLTAGSTSSPTVPAPAVPEPVEGVEGMGDGWVEKKLNELISIKHGFAFKSEFFQPNGEHVLLTPGNYFEDGGYRDRGEKQKYYVGEIPEGFILQEGDLLVAMTEQAPGLLGSPLLVPEQGKFLHNQRLGLVTINEGVELSNEFLFHLFNTKHFRDEVFDSGTGLKVRHTSPTKIGDITVCINFNSEVQQNVVQLLNGLKERVQELQTNYTQKLTELEDLKKSLLERAFKGEI